MSLQAMPLHTLQTASSAPDRHSTAAVGSSDNLGQSTSNAEVLAPASAASAESAESAVSATSVSDSILSKDAVSSNGDSVNARAHMYAPPRFPPPAAFAFASAVASAPAVRSGIATRATRSSATVSALRKSVRARGRLMSSSSSSLYASPTAASGVPVYAASSGYSAAYLSPYATLVPLTSNGSVAMSPTDPVQHAHAHAHPHILLKSPTSGGGGGYFVAASDGSALAAAAATSTAAGHVHAFHHHPAHFGSHSPHILYSNEFGEHHPQHYYRFGFFVCLPFLFPCACCSLLFLVESACSIYAVLHAFFCCLIFVTAYLCHLLARGRRRATLRIEINRAAAAA
jgi:hypothetical protein